MDPESPDEIDDDVEIDVLSSGCPVPELVVVEVTTVDERVVEKVGGGLVEPNSPPLLSPLEERDELDGVEVAAFVVVLLESCDVVASLVVWVLDSPFD